MTKHEETARRILPCVACEFPSKRAVHSTACGYRPAVAAALAQVEAKGVRMGLERAREIVATGNIDQLSDAIDAEIAFGRCPSKA